MRRIRRHLSFANVVSVIALFVAISGGTAVALNGSNTVQSDDLGPGAQVKAPDVAAGSVGSPAVINESLTGQDVKNQSGVDTCTHGTVRLGQLCMKAQNVLRNWFDAATLCASLDLRLPTFSEGLELAKTHDMPNVDTHQYFWTQDSYQTSSGQEALIVNDNANISGISTTGMDFEPVCVTTPTN